jgi:N-carbamoylputrescine amidase
VAAIQMVCGKNKSENVEKALSLVRSAAEQGAQIILLQELFETVYFCQEQSSEYFNWAHEVYIGSNHLSSSSSSPMSLSGSYLIDLFAKLAAELHVVLPISFFERANNVFYNSVVIIDANGICLGKYRKSHIPDGPGYQEKFYFSPGDTGFKVFDTTYGKIGD